MDKYVTLQSKPLASKLIPAAPKGSPPMPAEEISSHQVFPPKQLKTTGFGGRKGICISAENVHTLGDNNRTENQEFRPNSFVEFVESQLVETTIQDTIESKALNSFHKVFARGSNRPTHKDEKDIRLWLATLMHSGVTRSTAKRYLSKLSSLYAEHHGKQKAAEIFGNIRKDFDTLPQMMQGSIDSSVIEKIKRLPTKVDWSDPDADVYGKLLLYILYSWPMPISEAINLRFDSVPSPSDHQDQILKSQQAPRRSYVFPLGQGRKREPQIKAEITAGIRRILGGGVCALEDLLAGVWIEAAIKSRLSLNEIASIAPHIPQGYAWLGPIKRESLPSEQTETITRSVAEYLNPSCPRWYAMHLRAYQTHEKVKACIDEARKELKGPLCIFSPTKTTKVRVGKKLVKEETPLVPQIIFFKCRPEMVSPLFRLIGDYAWCIRTINSPDAPYAVIPAREMDEFQRFIGVLDEESKIAFLNSGNFNEGDEVEIIGGIYSGYKGELIKVSKQGEPKKVNTFTLRLNNDNNIIWEATMEEFHIKPSIKTTIIHHDNI